MPDFGAILEEHVEDVVINQTFAVEDIDESEDSSELLALEAGRTILEHYDDIPVEVLDLGESGWAIGGESHILMMPTEGKPSIMALPEGDEEEDDDDDEEEDDDEMEGKMAYRMKKGEKVGKGMKIKKGMKMYRDKKSKMRYMFGDDNEKYYCAEDIDEHGGDEDTVHVLVFAPGKVEQFREIAETLGLSDDDSTDIRLDNDGNIEVTLPEAIANQIKLKLGGGAEVRETTVSATVGGFAGAGDDAMKKTMGKGVGGKPTPGKSQKNPKKIPSKMEKRWYGDPDVGGGDGTVPESMDREELDYLLNALELLDEAFTRKHYTAIANILKNSKTVAEAGGKIAAMFAEDNPAFKKSMFLKAAGINESTTGMPEFENLRKKYNDKKIDDKGGARFGESEEGGTTARLTFPQGLATDFSEAVKSLSEEDKKHKINVGQNGHGNIEVFLPESLARKLEGRLNNDAVTVEV